MSRSLRISVRWDPPTSSPIFERARAPCTTRSAPAAWAAPRRVRRRCVTACAWRRAPAGGGRLGVSHGDIGQHQCPDLHGGAKRPPTSSCRGIVRGRDAIMKLDSVKVFLVNNPPPGFGGRYFVFLKLKTACGIEGVGEVYAATFGPKVIGRDDRGCVRAALRRARSVSDRVAVARELWLGIQPAPRPIARWASSAAWRWRAGTSSARRSSSRSTISWAARCTSGCAATPISIPADGRGR